jgi:hypothetical protein
MTRVVAGFRTATSAISFETWVRDFECVVEAASFRQFTLVATCRAAIAIEYAARHPERVSPSSSTDLCARSIAARSAQPGREARVLLDLTRRLGPGEPRQLPAGMGVELSAGRHAGTFALWSISIAPPPLPIPPLA